MPRVPRLSSIRAPAVEDVARGKLCRVRAPLVGELLQAAGLTEVDGGIMTLNTPGDAPAFVKACRAVRFWDRAA